MNCKEATLLIEKRNEGKLSFWKRLQLNLHLKMCAYCKRFDSQWKHIEDQLKTHFDKVALSTKDKESIKKQIS